MFEGLRLLKDAGTISTELSEWAEHLRFLRNIAAHDVAQDLTKDDAVDSLDFLHAILETLYHLRPKFEAMKQRRAHP